MISHYLIIVYFIDGIIYKQYSFVSVHSRPTSPLLTYSPLVIHFSPMDPRLFILSYPINPFLPYNPHLTYNPHLPYPPYPRSIKDTMNVPPGFTFGVLSKVDPCGAGDLIHERQPINFTRG